MIQRVLICGLLLLLAACQSAPKFDANVREGQWRAKALIKDREQSHSYLVYLDLNLVRDQRARMDVTTGLGTGVASMLVDAHEVRYLLVDSKRFYYGVPQPGVMRPILAIPFDPRWLNNVLFEEPITDKGWTCARGDGDLLSTCENPNAGLKITWSNRHGDKKTVLIEHDKASVEIKVTSFRPKVEDRKNLFVLEAPESFKKFHVR